MPPIINLTQSALPYAQYEAWTYQPWATGLDDSTPPQWCTPENFARRLPDAVVATTSSLPSSTYATVDGVGQITANNNAALVSDGYTLVANDTILVKNESFLNRNGLYSVTNPGSTSTPWVLTRHSEMSTSSKFVGFVLVLTGNFNKGKIFLCPPNPITPGVSLVTFEEWRNRWISSPLPAGKVLNPATGSLGGAATEAGAFVVGLQCSSDSGQTWSETANVVIGIDQRPPPPHSGIDLEIDVATRKVTAVEEPMTVTYGDDFLARVKFVKAGSPVAMGALSALKIGLRERDDEMITTVGGGEAADLKEPPHFGPGPGDPSIYLLYCHIVGDNLLELVRNSDDPAPDEPQYVDLEAEIEWAEANDSGVGPVLLQRSSVPFTVRVYDEIIS